MSGSRLERALLAVHTASLATRSVQEHLDQGSDARTKSDRSPVTVADFAAQALVGHVLGEDFVGEEDTQLLLEDPDLRARVLAAVQRAWPDATEPDVLQAIGLGELEPRGGAYWTLDPVDGTKGFLRGAHYCISLAYVKDGQAELGVLGCPRLSPILGTLNGPGTIAWAERGQGAFAAPLDDRAQGHPLRRLPAQGGAAAVLVESAEASHTNHALGPDLLDRAGLVGAPPIRVDSQVKYAVVARGDADIFLRRPKASYREKVWDHAAGVVVAEEAGCTVSDFDGHPIRFDDVPHLAPHRGLLVAPPELHRRLLKALDEGD